LGVLAAGALLAGFFGYGMIADDGAWWAGAIFTHPDNHVLHDMHDVPFLVKVAPILAMAVGLGLSYLFYMSAPGLPARVVATVKPLHTFFYNKWYFDELYDRLFVRPAKALGLGLWRGGDQAIIDRFGPDGVAAAALATARRAARLQTGFVYHYAFAMLIGVAFLVSWYMMVGRG
jgi:NADH-quinone oxidoreductase subunit L